MLTFTYIALAVVGCGYVAVALALGQAFDADAAGDATDGAFHFPLLSPVSLAAFCGATGALGLIATHGLGLKNAGSVAVAMAGGLVFTYVVTYTAWRLIVSSSGTQALRESDLVGAAAEVVTPIPEDGVGEVMTVVRGQRHAAPARTADGQAVSRGTLVQIDRVAGVTLIVRRVAADG